MLLTTGSGIVNCYSHVGHVNTKQNIFNKHSVTSGVIVAFALMIAPDDSAVRNCVILVMIATFALILAQHQV